MKRLLHLVPACLLVWGLPAFGDAHYKDGDAWRIVEDEQDGSILLENVKDEKLRHEIYYWVGPGYRYLGHLPVEKDDMVLLVYFGGSAGTSEIVHMYGAIVFNTRTRKFYGNFPFRLERPDYDERSDTIYSFGESSFTVIDRYEELNVTIDY